MRLFCARVMPRQWFADEPKRRAEVEAARRYAATQGFRGRVSFAECPPHTNTRGVIPLQVRVWP